MGVDEAVWANVRRAHEDATEPAAQFCQRLGVSVSTYYRRRKREGWPTRAHLKKGARHQQKAKSPPQSSSRDDGGLADVSSDLGLSSSDRRAKQVRGASPKRLTKRLYAAIDQESQQLEAGANDGPATSVADIERRTRTLMNMIRGLEKVLELDTDKQKTKGGRAKRGDGQSASRRDAGVSADDAERMRQDIADRLERLHAQWADPPGSGGAGS